MLNAQACALASQLLEEFCEVLAGVIFDRDCCGHLFIFLVRCRNHSDSERIISDFGQFGNNYF
jgi:hypothetical protein